MRAAFGKNRGNQTRHGCDELPGIVIRRASAVMPPPRIQAFVWGGKVPPTPTLPFGRWKDIA